MLQTGPLVGEPAGDAALAGTLVNFTCSIVVGVVAVGAVRSLAGAG